MSYCWRFIVSKNRLQCNSTKIPHGYWRQANLFVSITIRTDLPGILLPMRLRNDLSFSKKAIFHFVKKNGKISAQPYPTKCIQFLDRENNEKNNTLPLGKQICFSIVWGCAENSAAGKSNWMHFLENNFPQYSLYLDISFFVNLRTMLSKNISETFISVLDVISREVWRWEN